MLYFFAVAVVMILSKGEAMAQFTIDDSSDAKSIKSRQKMVVSGYDMDIVNDALLKKQRKDTFNARNYLEMTSGLTVSQSGFTNWAAGGDGTFTGRASLYARHVYARNKFTNDNYINTAYGLGESNDKLWKNEDMLELNSSLGYQMYKKWYYSTNVNFTSQFANGYTSQGDSLPVSSFLAPATINISVGLSYTRNENCKISLMPVSGNLVVVNDMRISESGLYAVDPGKKIKADLGAYVSVTWQETIIKDVLTYKTLASSFSNYKTVPTLNWQSWLTLKANKYLSVDFYGYLIYDPSVTTPNGSLWQFSETLGVGLSYTFKNRDKL